MYILFDFSVEIVDCDPVWREWIFKWIKPAQNIKNKLDLRNTLNIWVSSNDPDLVTAVRGWIYKRI